jgi:DNA-binding transcriptional ArsR family regulator
MSNAPDLLLFRTLADPTRRAIFERLCRDGEQTVGALTARPASRSRRCRSTWGC